MIKLRIICIGKLKEQYLRDASKEYEKRLSRYCNLEIVELASSYIPDNPSKAETEKVLLEEADIIQRKIPDGFYKIALCIEGKELTSEDFSDKISSLVSMGKSICLIIGSSYGLSDTIKEKADLMLSLSKMTFPHQLFRVMLEEQLYRCFKIIEGSTYHK